MFVLAANVGTSSTALMLRDVVNVFCSIAVGWVVWQRMGKTSESTKQAGQQSVLTRQGKWMLLAFGGGTLAAGIPLWPIPYSELSIAEGSLPGIWSIAICTVAALTSFRTGMGVVRSTFVVGSGLPAAIFIRVVVEGIADPTSHNLWPFEVFLGIFIGLPAALVGSTIGWFIRRNTGYAGK
jgi:hypothetical protein